ncbi:isocitrate lyase/phosphoenolpyruvate mutase family protein [Alloalcanivorax gelatiniphagus]
MTSSTPFAALHASGTFVIPNPRDVGEARLLEGMGFPALATTSAGFAATLGRADQSVTLDELVAHVGALTGAVEVPVSVDAENGFADDPAQVARTVLRLAEAGAAGVSVEDHDPVAGTLYPAGLALERVQAAAEAARTAGVVLTARSEGLLRGTADLDETLARLRSFEGAGAGCLYAPGPRDLATIATLVGALTTGINVLAWPGGPSVDELAGVGVRRVSVGSWFSTAASAAVVGLARTLADGGGLPEDLAGPPADLVERAWRRR